MDGFSSNIYSMKRAQYYIPVISLVLDLIAVCSALIIAFHWRSGGEQIYGVPYNFYLQLVVYSLPIWIVSFLASKMYSINNFPSGWRAIGSAFSGLLKGWGTIFILLYLIRLPETQVLPRLLIVYALILSAVFVLASKLINELVLAAFYSSKKHVKRVLIVGNNPKFVKSVTNSWRHGRKIVAQLANLSIPEIEKIFDRDKFDEIAVVDGKNTDESLYELLLWAERNSCSFAIVPSLLELRSQNIEVSNLGGTPVTFFHRTPLDGWGRITKRLIDVLLVIPFIIISLPIQLIVAILVSLTSRGPVLYKQARVGQDGRVFYVHKFRSMYKDGDDRFKEMAGWSGDEASDPRITPLGRVLRRFDLDEIPQFYDVLIGKMSLVGPRPEQPKYVDKFSKDIPTYLNRHYVKTGLTGWAQINGLRGDTSIEERVKYDLDYIQRWSPWFDLRIMLATIYQIIKKAL